MCFVSFVFFFFSPSPSFKYEKVFFSFVSKKIIIMGMTFFNKNKQDPFIQNGIFSLDAEETLKLKTAVERFAISVDCVRDMEISEVQDICRS